MSRSQLVRLALVTPLFLGGSLVAGCINLAPDYERPAAPITGEWPIPPTTRVTPAAAPQDVTPDGEAVPVADVGWRDFIADDRLEQLVALALEGNRDLRLAVLDVARTRARWHIQRADRLPSVDANASNLRQRLGGDSSGTGDSVTRSQYDLEVGITAYELDLFGRVRNLSQAALERYFATEEARRGAQLSLIAEVVRTYLTLAADSELQRLAEETVTIQADAFHLTERRHELGGVSGLEVAQAQTTVESARVDAAHWAGQVALDRNALALLVGGPIDPALLPEGFVEGATGLQALPAGLPSEVLLRRPDVLAAERELRAAHADIGAARAAFFPRISLTATGGTFSAALGDLFVSGNAGWTFLPQITVPIFAGGRLRAGRDLAWVERDAAIASYEQAIQVGFREVADALALTSTLAQERQARQALADAARRAYELSQARHESGRDSYLISIDAQRTWYAAQQGLIATRLAEQANRVALYRALGGGWLERTGSAAESAAADTAE